MLRIITFDQNTHSTELQQLDKKLLSACFVLKINQFHHHWCYELFGYLSSDVKYGLHVKVNAPYFTYRFPSPKKKKKKKVCVTTHLNYVIGTSYKGNTFLKHQY